MQIDDIKQKIAPILSRYQIAEAYLFGSVARGDATLESDVDVLIQFRTLPDLLDHVHIKHELEDALGGRKVDLVQMEALRPEFRAHVDNEKVRIYG